MALIVIIAVNIAVFLTMFVATGGLDWDADTLLGWGANFTPMTLHGQWWRLLSAPYLHANLMHIAGNMVLLLVAGTFVQAKIRSVYFLLVYTSCGIAAGLLSVAGNPNAVGVGASGAIAGIVGVMVVLYASGRAPEISGKWVAQTVGMNAIYSFAPNVDGLAHLGGFLFGLVCGGGLVAASIVPQPGIER